MVDGGAAYAKVVEMLHDAPTSSTPYNEESDPVTPCKSGFRYYSQPIWEAYGQCWPSCEQMGGVVSLPFGAQQVQACCDSGCGVCTNN